MQTRDSNARDFLVGIIVGFVLLLALVHLGGCAVAHASDEVAITPVKSQPSERGHIVIRVRIVDTDPSDDVVLSFVYLGARLVELMRGEPVQEVSP